MNIIWLDDDTPSEPFSVGPVSIQTAGSCKEAEEILLRGELPDWIIVDMIVPQGGWGEKLFKLPGLEFVKFVSSQYGEKIRIAAYSIIMPPDIVKRLQAIGVTKYYAKSTLSLIGVIEDLVVSQT